MSFLRSLAVLLVLSTVASAFPMRRQTIPQRIAQKVGKAAGFIAGYGVTAGLVVFKKWRQPLVDKDGQVVTAKVGDRVYQPQARHAPILGPQMKSFAAKMSLRTRLRRLSHALVDGFADGATDAPPAEGRVEGRLGLLRAAK